jgi:soluble lytic murein transglycosylase-like protein
VITQESGWNRWAVSKVGAQGLMQLMPATSAHYNVTDPFDISQNIGAGVQYLAELIAQFRDWRLAIASYYCGPTYPQQRGLGYSNQDVIAYVRSVQLHYSQELALAATQPTTPQEEAFVADQPSEEASSATEPTAQQQEAVAQPNPPEANP